ncbi:MAG: transposase, partial [Candidatus Lokiarchaeota archaeon]|nr:transposase [Candidatus Lokiarchaeota archaeon]
MTIERKAGRDGYNTKTFGSIASQLRPWYQRHSEGGIIRTLEVKVQTPIKVDRWFPSTKTCSRCGTIRDIGLDERSYVCPVCGLVIDRDFNSSHNLENEGLKQVPTGRRDV